MSMAGLGFGRRLPRVDHEYDDSAWCGPGPEPWWFRHCTPRLRQAHIDQLARRGLWKGKLKKGKSTRLSLGLREAFGCKNLAHFAVALADLDCTVRVTEPVGYCDIRRGQITFPGRQGLPNATAEPTPPGQIIHFDVSGPDREAALPIVRETFEQGLADHLAVYRKYTKLNPRGALPG